MKNIVKATTVILALLSIASCKKETATSQGATSEICDLNIYSGDWKFTLNEDPSTEYIGQIHKFDNNTINIHYQPSTEYNNFLQTDIDCETGASCQNLPAGNHGTTTIEMSISLTNFDYTKVTRINYTGQEQVTTTRIQGTKI